MARLPRPGSDESNWGELLNEFLSVEHNDDGTLRASGSLGTAYHKPADGIPSSDLSAMVQASLALADDAPTTLAGLHDVTVGHPSDGQVLTYESTSHRWVNASSAPPAFARSVAVSVTKADVGLGNVDNTSDKDKPVSNDAQKALDGKETLIVPATVLQYYRGDKTWQTLDKTAVGLGNVTNEAHLPLTGGVLSGSIRTNDGSTIRAYHTDNTKYIELKTDNFWSRINAGATSGVVLTGTTVQMDAVGGIVTYTPTIRPNTNLNTHIGDPTHFYNNLYAQRHYLNATAYLDGATTGFIGISDGAHLSLGTIIGTKIGTAITQKIGFFNAAPVAQQAGGALSATASYTANEQLMLNRMWTALRNLGLIN